MRTLFLIFKTSIFLSVFASNFALADTKIVQLTNSIPEEIMTALRPHLDKKTKLSAFKNQLIISADAKEIAKSLQIIAKLDTAEDFYKVSFLIAKFPLKQNSYSTGEKVYSIQTQANKVAKVHSDFILPFTKVSKDGEISKEFKLFKEGFSLSLKPSGKDRVVLNFGLINQTNPNKHKAWNKQELISNIQAPLGFWQLVGESKSIVRNKATAKYSTKGERFFYLCAEKLQNSVGCNVK